MSKRLQVILKDPEYREIQRAARSRRMSIAEWVRQALDLACRREPAGGVSKKLEIIRAAAQYDYPVSDIDGMLAEIERGYGTARIRGSGRLEYPHVSDWRSSCPEERWGTVARKGGQRGRAPGYGRRGSPGDPAPLRRNRPPRRHPTRVRHSARHRGPGSGCGSVHSRTCETNCLGVSATVCA